ncbi:MAG: sugar phosphate isomerase/epimerase family protein [Sphaerochaetaceae bacterium]
MEIGLQVFSIREALQADFYGTLEKVAEIGYKNIEFANHHADTDDGIGFNIPAHTLKRFLDAQGLKPISCHAGPLDEKNIQQVIAYHQELGNNSLGLSIGFWPNKEAVEAFAKKLNKLGEIVTKAGMNFYYHNHFMEFQKFGEKSVFEYFLELTDKDLVKFEFDLYWALRGGLEHPENYLDVLGERCDLIHQKDLPKNVKDVNIIASLQENEEITFEKFKTYSKVEYFSEVGSGVMNVPNIIAKAKQHAIKYIIVEQDHSQFGELESVKMSYEYLTKQLNA